MSNKEKQSKSPKLTLPEIEEQVTEFVDNIMPQFPHTQKLLQMFDVDNKKTPAENNIETELDKGFFASDPDIKLLREMLKSFAGEYEGLSLIEKYGAVKGLSSSAHVANNEQDYEILELFQDAFNSIKYSNINHLPRLVVCESDIPFAKAFAIGGDGTVFISSNLIEILKENLDEHSTTTFENKIKAIFRHELSHVNDLSEHKFSFLGISNIIPSMRREAEHRADNFGALEGKEADALSDALMQIQIRMEKLTDVIRVAGEQVTTELKKYVPDNFASKMTFRKIEKQLGNNNTSRIDRVTENSKYHPSMADRLAKIQEGKENYIKGRQAPYR